MIFPEARSISSIGNVNKWLENCFFFIYRFLSIKRVFLNEKSSINPRILLKDVSLQIVKTIDWDLITFLLIGFIGTFSKLT
jgi:hypothetical protein